MDEQLSSTVEIATLPSRLLAAGLDYVVSVAIFVLLNHLNPTPDLSFLFSLLGGLLYFGVVHSQITRGQSLGKRAFGLRVVRVNGPIFLRPAEACLRYLFTMGLIILVAELPPIFFRAGSVVAGPTLLEAHMLLVMLYFFLDVWLWISSPAHRSLHDRLSGSLVLRGEAIPTRADIELILKQTVLHPNLLSRLSRTYIALPICFAAALFFWSLGFSSSQELKNIAAHRYELEHNFPIRILSLSRRDASISLEALLLDPLLWKSKEFASNFARALQSKGGLTDPALRTLQCTWYRDPSLKDDQNSSKSILGVNLQTFEVQVLGPEQAPADGNKPS